MSGKLPPMQNGKIGHSVLSTSVLFLGLAGLTPGWGLPFAALSVGLGIFELGQIRKAQTPRGGKPLVLCGMFFAILGSLYTLFGLVLGLWLRD